MNVADNVWFGPAFRTVPAVGLYPNVPGTSAVAFNCTVLRAVPYAMSLGLFQVIVGVAFSTLIVTDLVTVV